MRSGHAVRIVTVSREYGAGGRELARRLGEHLGWRVVDRSLVEEVAKRLGEDAEVVEGLDEHVGGLLERVGQVFSRGTVDVMLEAVDISDPDAIARMEHAVIRAVAKSPPVVIVGRGAQCLLAEHPEALHVRLVAPFEARVARASQSRSVPTEQAQAEAREADVERRRYIRHHFHREPDDPQLYDLQLNTGAIGLEEATDLVLSIIHRRAMDPA